MPKARLCGHIPFDQLLPSANHALQAWTELSEVTSVPVPTQKNFILRKLAKMLDWEDLGFTCSNRLTNITTYRANTDVKHQRLAEKIFHS